MDFNLLVFMLATALSSAVLLGIVILAFPLLQKTSASLRHQVLVAAFTGLLSLPFLPLVLPTLNLPEGPRIQFLDRLANRVAQLETGKTAIPSVGVIADPGDEHATSADQSITPPPGTGKTPGEQFSRATGTLQTSGKEFSPFARVILSNLSWLVLVFWGAGAIAILVTQLVRWAGAGFMAEMATGVEDPLQRAMVEKIRRELGIRKPVVLLRSELAAVAMVWGIWKPYIVLPADSNKWKIEKIEAVLRHELAHVRRRDNAVHLLAVFVCALYWFNPMIWMAMRKLHFEREMSCDDFVLNSGTLASVYARHLLEVTSMLTGPKSNKIIPSVMAHSSNVKKRIQSVLNPDTNRRPTTRLSALGFVPMFILLTLMVSVFHPRAIAGNSIAKQAEITQKHTKKEDPKSNQKNDDGDLFSADYYKELKSKEPGDLKSETLLNKIYSGEHEIDLDVIAFGIETRHKYQNAKWEIKGKIRSEGDLIFLDDISLYDPEDDFRMEARNMILDPDSTTGYRVDPANTRKGWIIISKPVDDMLVKYKIETTRLGDSGIGTTLTCYVDKKQIPAGAGRQVEERRYLLGRAYSILMNRFITFSDPPML